MAASLALTIDLDSEAAGQTTTLAGLEIVTLMAAEAQAVTVVTADPDAYILLQAASAGQLSVIADLETEEGSVSLAATAAALSSMAADPSASLSLSAQADIVSYSTADLSADEETVDLAATASGISSTGAGLALVTSLAAEASGVTVVTADPGITASLAALIAVQSTAEGQVSLTLDLAAGIAGTAGVTANLITAESLMSLAGELFSPRQGTITSSRPTGLLRQGGRIIQEV
jgi:hypothetical protein